MRRVLVTGASSGIGEGLARHYARPGAVLGLVARRADALEHLASELREAGAEVEVYPADVRDTDAMRQIAFRFAARADGVDLVVACAGGSPRGAGVRDGDAHEVARLVALNVVGVTNTLIPFVPLMLRQRAGVLCAVGSFAGHRALPGRTAYSATKAAVRVFMDGLRMDLHGTGVHAMTLCPGYVRTPLTADVAPMPFAQERDAAVEGMARAIARRGGTVTLPWQLRLLAAVFTRLPEWLLRRLAPPPRATSSA